MSRREEIQEKEIKIQEIKIQSKENILDLMSRRRNPKAGEINPRNKNPD
jgi:hypothetical protein